MLALLTFVKILPLKTTTNLAGNIKQVCLEDLNVKGMMQNGKLAASVAPIRIL